MTSRLCCFRRSEGGSLTVEAMLTLPALLMALLLCLALVYGIHGAMVLDHALAETCSDLAEGRYLMMRARTFGADLIKGSGLIQQLIGSDVPPELEAAIDVAGMLNPIPEMSGYLLAGFSFRSNLKKHPEIIDAVDWRLVRMPEPESDFAWGSGKLEWEGRQYDEDDVVLALVFTPARINRITSLLPDSWQFTMYKRERAWLTGQNERARKGQEQPAGKKENGPLVYITNYGIKYHMDGCQYLRKSQYPVYLNQLSETYDGCSKCKPPPRQTSGA